MAVLSDYLAPNLRLVICGTAAGRVSAARGHYYAGPGNRFWEYLHVAGLTPIRLRPEDDASILRYGIGLTDVAKTVAAGSDKDIAPSAFDAQGFIIKMERLTPNWIGFHGKESAKVVLRHLGRRGDLVCGDQSLLIGGSRVFILPSASAANQRHSYDGRVDRVDWFKELARLAGFVDE